MPQQTIYIRNDDMPKWKALKNKSEFLSNALRGVQSSGVTPEKEELGSSPLPPTIPSNLAPRFCKNGHPIPYPKEKCLGKGCKYS